MLQALETAFAVTLRLGAGPPGWTLSAWFGRGYPNLAADALRFAFGLAIGMGIALALAVARDTAGGRH